MTNRYKIVFYLRDMQADPPTKRPEKTDHDFDWMQTVIEYDPATEGTGAVWLKAANDIALHCRQKVSDIEMAKTAV